MILARFPAVAAAGRAARLAWFLPALVWAAMGVDRRWIAEDAFIAFRTVRHLAEGYGPVFNLGERVEGFTSPLWVGVLAAWAWAGGRIEPAAVALGVALSVAGLLAAQAGAARLARRTAGAGAETGALLLLPFGALIVCALPPFWDFMTSGLETGLTFGWLGASFWTLARIFTRPGLRPGPRLSRSRGPQRPAPLPRGRAVRAAVMRPLRRIGISRGEPHNGPISSGCPIRPAPAAVLFGLGPLIRPDLALFSAGFVTALCAAATSREAELKVGAARAGRGGGWRTAARLALAAALAPAAYQIFRMGYYASLVPNSALAKEAGLARWPQGWEYVKDLVLPYHLAIPLAAAAVWWGVLAARAAGRRDRAALVVLATPVVAALLHALYVVRVGGDFMHGRMLLPALFGMLLPVMAIGCSLPTAHRPPRTDDLPTAHRPLPTALWPLATVFIWSIVCIAALRVPYAGTSHALTITDERGYYVAHSARRNPVRLDDFERLGWYHQALGWRERAEEAPGLLRFDREWELPEEEYPMRSDIHTHVAIVVVSGNTGIAGFLAAPAVHLVDRLGLSDPIAGRLRLTWRGRPGHEKSLPRSWVLARFGDPGAVAADPDAAAARRALECGPLATLREAIEAPLTLERFARNVTLAWRLTRLRIPAEPEAARAEFCRD